MTLREAIEQTRELAEWANSPRVQDLIPADWTYLPFESQAMVDGVYARAWLAAGGRRISIDITLHEKERNDGRAFELVRVKVECAVLCLRLALGEVTT